MRSRWCDCAVGSDRLQAGDRPRIYTGWLKLVAPLAGLAGSWLPVPPCRPARAQRLRIPGVIANDDTAVFHRILGEAPPSTPPAHAGSTICWSVSTLAIRSGRSARYPHVAYPSRLYLAAWPNESRSNGEFLMSRSNGAPLIRRHRNAVAIHRSTFASSATVVPRAQLSEERSEMYILLQALTSWEPIDCASKATCRRRSRCFCCERCLHGGRYQRVLHVDAVERRRIDDRDIVAFFSGDTIVDRGPGETVLSRIWGHTVFGEADRVASKRQPGDRSLLVSDLLGLQDVALSAGVLSRILPEAEQPDTTQVIDTSRRARRDTNSGIHISRVRHRAIPRCHAFARWIASLTAARLRDPHVRLLRPVMNPGNMPMVTSSRAWRSFRAPTSPRAAERMIRVRC